MQRWPIKSPLTFPLSLLDCDSFIRVEMVEKSRGAFEIRGIEDLSFSIYFLPPRHLPLIGKRFNTYSPLHSRLSRLLPLTLRFNSLVRKRVSLREMEAFLNR